jgi:2-keto-3-deoxy-L-rhamnonate aldolase RhmA
MRRPFDLFLFSADPAAVESAVAAGVAGAVIDWERVGKRHRQAGADTQIGEDTIDDLARVRAATSAKILCRIDHTPALLDEQIEAAVAAGADEVMLPMVRSASEAEQVLDDAGGRCGVGILIETASALEDLDALSSLPLTRTYVGLNDLAIERGSQNIFEPLVDGPVDEIRAEFAMPFGLAGLTVVEGGTPIPARLLIGELVRLGCTFSFLRRSYHADIRGRDPAREIPLLFEAIETARTRTPAEIAADRDALADAVDEWSGVLASR